MNSICSRKSPHAVYSGGASAVNIPFTFKENPPVLRLGEHQGHVNGFAAIVQIDGIEQRLDIVGVQPNAAVSPVAVYADGMIGAVNADDGEAQADPVLAERVVRTGLDLVDNVLALLFLFTLNRCGRAPGRILLHLDHRE